MMSVDVAEHTTNVWEGFDIITKSLEKGILLTKDVVRFYKKRLEIEEVYCKSLQKAVQKFEPLVVGGFVGENLAACWQEMRAETEVQASLHESLFTNIKECIVEPFEKLIIDLEQKHKQFLGEGQKSHNDAKESIVKLKKMKVAYDKLYRESMDVGNAAGAANLPKRDTQRLQKRTLKLTHELIKADGDYKQQIAETNGFQTNYTKEHIPKIMTLFNKMESVRLHIFKQYLIKYFKTIEALPQTFPNCRQKIIDLLNMNSNEEDITEFLNRNKNHLAMPKPFEYVEPVEEQPQQASSGHRSRPVSMSFSPAALASFAGAPPAKTVTPPTPTKKDGGFPMLKIPSNPKKDGTPPQPIPNIKKPEGRRDSTTGGNKATSPPTPTQKDKEKDGKWWGFRHKKQTSVRDMRRSKHVVFGAKLEDIMMDQKMEHPDAPIPYLLFILRDVIMKMDGVHTEGIFRVPGNANDVISFKRQFDDGDYEIVTENVHTAAAIFKLWLRELPDPVFPYASYDKCLRATTATATLAIVDQLPEINKNVLRFVVELLRDISKFSSVNKMSVDNLAMVFAPCLLRSMSSDPASLLENSTKEKEFIVIVIENLPIPTNILPSLDSDSSPSTPTSTTPVSSTPPLTTPTPTTPTRLTSTHATQNHVSHTNHVGHPSSELSSSNSSNEGGTRSLNSSGLEEEEPMQATKPERRTHPTLAKRVSMSAILEENESPIMTPMVTIPASPPTEPAVQAELVKSVLLDKSPSLPVTKKETLMLDDDEILQPPTLVKSPTTPVTSPSNTPVTSTPTTPVNPPPKVFPASPSHASLATSIPVQVNNALLDDDEPLQAPVVLPRSPSVPANRLRVPPPSQEPKLVVAASEKSLGVRERIAMMTKSPSTPNPAAGNTPTKGSVNLTPLQTSLKTPSPATLSPTSTTPTTPTPKTPTSTPAPTPLNDLMEEELKAPETIHSSSSPTAAMTEEKMLDDGETLSAPLVISASTTFSPRQTDATVKEAHRVRAQVLAESIATQLEDYLQSLSQSEVSYSKMKSSVKRLKQKLGDLDGILHQVEAPASSSVLKANPSIKWMHLNSYTAPSLPASTHEAALQAKEQKRYASLIRVIIQTHEKVHEIARCAEFSASLDEVKAMRTVLKAYKKDLIQRPLGEDEPSTDAVNDGTGSDEGAEGADVAGEADAEPIDGLDLLRNLETHVSDKRVLLDANEDELSADDTSDLINKRMALARAISPIKKELDQFCKECKIAVVADARYPIDDMNSEVKFLRKMILHVLARICYLAKEGVAHIQQQADPHVARELYDRLAATIESLAQ